jgi:hypothetical protein
VASRPRPGRFVAELVGVAGSGKSTLLRALRDELGLPVPYRLPRARSLPILARVAARSLAPLLLEPHPGWFWFELKLLASYEAMVADLAAASPGLPILLDQGPVYSYVVSTRTVLLGERRSRLRPRLVRMLDAFASHLGAVLWLDAPDEVLLERIRGRGQRHVVKAMGKDEALAFLGEYRAAYDALLERLARLHGVPVLRFDTAAEPAPEIARRVGAELGRSGLGVP